jgi:hypothetical protein
MQLTYRGISYTLQSTIAAPEKMTLTYRGVTFDRLRSDRLRPNPVGLTYRGQKYERDSFSPAPAPTPRYAFSI